MAEQSTKSTIIVVGVICGLVAIGAGLKSFTSGPSPVAQQAMQNLDQFQKQTNSELRKQLDEGGIDPNKASDRAREGLAKANAAASALGGTEGEMLKQTLAVMAELNEQNAAYTRRATALSDGGGLEAKNLTEAAKLDASLKEIDWLIGETKRLEATIRAIPGKVQAALNKSGASQDAMSAFLRGAKLDQRVPLMLECNQCDTQIWESFKVLLSTQRAELGKWKVNGDQTVFENKEAQKAADEAIRQIGTAANKQVESQRKLLELGS